MKTSKIIVILGITFILIGHAACAQPVSSNELINNAKEYDGKAVGYRGEVIGDIMIRGGHAWININDGQNAVGIWVDKNLAKEIVCGGSYKYKGDEAEVLGVFHRSCTDHGGDLDIHAHSIRKIKSGRETVDILNFDKIRAALMLLGVVLAFLFWEPITLRDHSKSAR